MVGHQRKSRRQDWNTQRAHKGEMSTNVEARSLESSLSKSEREGKVESKVELGVVEEEKLS